MSRNLVINTTTDRIQRKWLPSPVMAIKEEDEQPQQKISQTRLEEEEEEDEDEDGDEEEEEDADADGSDLTSSPSIPDENINFDLVYTLHTFEATVDGQASVKKGDALTLLDDSNSYWWLIRDLKTSEVGYIPAENIETPFERLARLNKHRNIEITSIEQAAHYIHIEKKPKLSLKKVVLSTCLNIQLHVILIGENDEDIQEESYEEWNEEMLDGEDGDDDNKPLVNKPLVNKPLVNNRQISRAIQKTTPAPAPTNSKVLRIFAGNVNVGASYHSIRVNESTSVAELLSNVMEKFHISQIETKHGRFHKNSCVEYYLTVKKTRDGDEITLDSKDKPYAIYESLTTHLTTPMPSLTQFRQLASNNNKKKKRKSFTAGDYQSSIQFFMHKRIKRFNDKSGQVHIKVSLMASSTITTTIPEKINPIKKMTTLRFSKKKKDSLLGSLGSELERIDKLIAIPANISISDLTSIALVKFHIISDKDQSHQYRLILNANGKDTLLNSNQILSDVLRGAGGETTTNEKYFVLHNFNSNLDDQHQLSLSSSTSSSSSSSVPPPPPPPPSVSSKVFPEIYYNSYSHHPVMTRLDSNTEAILKRVDAALEAFEKNISSNRNQQSTKKTSSFPSPMSVSRNESGVDIHLPHGLLRSTALSNKKTQYSLMTTPNTLVFQKVLPAASDNNSSSLVTGEELETLIKYGSQYLDTYDTANKSVNNPSNRLIVERDDEQSLSSLEDLEKELQRIITSHSS